MSVKPVNAEIPLRKAIAELKRRHGIGENEISESVLNTFPELRENRESVLELIYFEYVLSQDSGSPISDDDLQRRFPEFQADLQKILNVDRAFRSSRDTDPAYDKPVSTDLAVGLENDADPQFEFDGFGDYEPVGILGQGGMGVVYKARQRRLNRLVAVKTIDNLSSLNPTAVARFRSEAELVAKLQHPNIVQVYEIGSQNGVPYFSMELVAGGTLAEAMSERPLVPDTAAKLVETLARAVHYAHSQSIIHRDLKPSNILLARSDRADAIELPVEAKRGISNGVDLNPRFEPKIADFGLAKYIEGALDRTATQAMIGTPSYMAPELIDSELGSVGPACDVYSLGAILYDALVGRPPFSAATVIETIHHVRNSDVIPPQKLQSKISRDLQTICLNCLRKEPSKRYASAKELADDLQRFLAGQPILARPTGIVEQSWKWTCRHPMLAGLIAAVTVALMCIASLWLRSEQSRAAEFLALKRNEQLLYDCDISLAQFEYQSNRVERSREILDKTRPEYRGWEWDYLYNQTKRSIWESPKQANPIVQADISPDGRFVAIASGVWGQDHPQSIDVWDSSSNELKWKLEGHPPSEACDVRFSPDGTLLLSAATVWKSPGAKGGVKLWDLSNGQLRFALSQSNSYAARFSKDGHSVFVGENEGWVNEYSVSSGKMIRKYVCSPQGQMILDLTFHPDGTKLLVATRDKNITLWNTKTGSQLQKLVLGGDPRKLAWSPDGKTISVSHYGGLRTVFRFESGQLKQQAVFKEAAIVYGGFTPDGSRFVSSVFGQSIEICDAKTGFLEHSLPAHNGHTKCIGFDASGRRMITGGGDNRVRIWDLAIGNRQPTRSVTWGAVVNAIAFDPIRDEMALAMQKHPNKKHGIEIRNVQSHQTRRELLGHSDWPTCVAYSSDGNHLISGSLDKTVRIWESSMGAECALLEGHQESVVGVSFLPNSSNAVSIDKAGTVYVWNVISKSIERSWKVDGNVESVSFHPVRQWMAVACKGNGVAIWDAFQGIKRAQLPLDEQTHSVCFSPNGDRLATVSDAPVTRVWQTENIMRGQPPLLLSELLGHSDTITSVSFSPDGRRLASLSRDESVRLFDVDLGYELFRLDSDKGTNGLVQFNVDGRSIVRTLPGNFSTWSIEESNTSTSQSLSLEPKAWHQSEANAAIKDMDFFAAEFHQGWLIKLEQDSISHFLDRADSRMFIGDFTGAEQDLRHCVERVDSTAKRRLLSDLARVCLSQEKWAEYQEICTRLSKAYGDSKNPSELNTLLWYSSLRNTLDADRTSAKKKLEALIANPKIAKSAYFNTLAMCHYREGDYPQAIRCAKESIRLLKGIASPIDWMVIALSSARLDEKRFDWLPRSILSRIRQWGFSRRWSDAVKHINLVDTWMDENTERYGESKKITRESRLLLQIELPYLRKEWAEMADAK